VALRWFDAPVDQNRLYQLFCRLLTMIGGYFGQVIWAIDAVTGSQQIRTRRIEPTPR
jgi:hypothetical protein